MLNVVWFKRDLRLHDNEALRAAFSSGEKVLLVYIIELSLLADLHYSSRHWRFIRQSVQDLNRQLAEYGAHVFVLRGEVVEVLTDIHREFGISGLFSNEETGLKVTYNRDKQVSRFCSESGIQWHEFQNNGVVRGLRNRTGWSGRWYSYMCLPQIPFQPEGFDVEFATLSMDYPPERLFPEDARSDEAGFQAGGETEAAKVLNTFLETRSKGYVAGISSPGASREHCSRVSPYLAWGNLSMRTVYQAQKLAKNEGASKKNLNAFASRLRWHCHFIQKFEMEDAMEFRAVNRGYEKLEKQKAPELLEAWKSGTTGFPMVDACMRCLEATGYINFRMRAMLVSFLCHHLWLDWRDGVVHLARLFLDFEPGIHYPQFQMQAGVTGINTIRMYNPVKQSLDNDSDAEFISEWVPELRNLPVPFRHQPWKISPLEAAITGFQPGVDYPDRIVDHEVAAKHARTMLWRHRGEKEVKQESWRILKKHTMRGRRERSV